MEMGWALKLLGQPVRLLMQPRLVLSGTSVKQAHRFSVKELQAAFLLKEGCEEAQGFLYSRPLSEADFECYLRAGQLPVLRRAATGALS